MTTNDSPFTNYRVDGGVVAVIRKGELFINGQKVADNDDPLALFPVIEQYADDRGMRVFRRGMLTFYIVGPSSQYWSRAGSRIPLSS